MNLKLAQAIVVAIIFFLCGVLVGLARQTAIAENKFEKLFDTAEVVISNTNISRADWTKIGNTIFTIVKDESTGKYYLHVDQGCITELPKGYGK